jgi:hypothetical protein
VYQTLGYFAPELEISGAPSLLSTLETFTFYQGATPETERGEELLFDVTVLDGQNSTHLIQQVFVRITPGGALDSLGPPFHADGVTWNPRTQTLRIDGVFPVGETVWLTVGDPRSCVARPMSMPTVSADAIIAQLDLPCTQSNPLTMDVNLLIPSAKESWTFPGAIWITGR